MRYMQVSSPSISNQRYLKVSIALTFCMSIAGPLVVWDSFHNVSKSIGYGAGMAPAVISVFVFLLWLALFLHSFLVSMVAYAKNHHRLARLSLYLHGTLVALILVYLAWHAFVFRSFG